MTQSHRASLLEAAANLGAGALLSFGLQLVLFPVYGFAPTLVQNATITVVFTLTTFLRSYLLRRLFVHLGAGP